MRKNLLGILLSLISAMAMAEVGVISVVDEDKYSEKSDFTNTFEYFITPLSNKSSFGSKCQATRIGKRWFATAAHCVANLCKNGCKIQIDLLDQPVSALATVKHTPKNPVVFIHPDFKYQVFVKNDLALIRLDLDSSTKEYYQRTADPKTRIAMTKKNFEEFLAENPTVRSALSRVRKSVFPPILVFDTGNYILDRKISVISIFDGVRSVKPNANPVHYVKDLEFAYTKNFGVRSGMSGSGVMSNTGEFVGVVSGIFQVSAAPSATVRTAKLENEFFMFFVFNSTAIEFMKDVMGSDFDKLDIKDAYPGYVHKSRKNYAEIVRQLKGFPVKKENPTAVRTSKVGNK